VFPLDVEFICRKNGVAVEHYLLSSLMTLNAINHSKLAAVVYDMIQTCSLDRISRLTLSSPFVAPKMTTS
jgi:hypothetical protein